MLFSDQYQTLLSICIAFLIVTASPGPANIAVASVAMQHGRRKGIRFGTGLALGLGFWGLIAATGMGAALKSSETMLFALKMFGATYLLWLAYNSCRAAMKPAAIASCGDERSGLFQGLMLNLSNPKAVFAWMAALSMGMSADSGSHLVLIALTLCIVLGFINYSLYAVTFSLPGFMVGYRRAHRWGRAVRVRSHRPAALCNVARLSAALGIFSAKRPRYRQIAPLSAI